MEANFQKFPFMGSREIPQKIWARSVQSFWRLLDTNRQTNKQTDKPNLYIDEEDRRFSIWKTVSAA